MKVSIIAAITIDGKIARSTDHFPAWTGKCDKKFFSSVTRKAGTIIMGSKTFDLIGRVLPERQNIIMTRNVKRVSNQENLIFTNKPAEKIISELRAVGCKHVLVCGGSQINHLFVTKNLVNELILTFVPIIFGEGISLFLKSITLSLELKSMELLEDSSICVVYNVLK